MTEWVNLFARWTHVFSAILWVGSTYYFMWLDGQLRRSGPGGVWMVHSGGFYTVVKQKALTVPPDQVHWFRWEALVTFLSGFTLLGVVYYSGSLMIDPISPAVSNGAAIGIGVSTLIVGWTVYDLLVRSPLIKNDVAFGVVGFALVMATAYGLSHVLSGRATYIHIGAMFGTIMVSNVWMRILPPQRRMMAAAARGEAIDETLGVGPKLRSKHNAYLVVPTTFIMISNHFPTATYGSHNAVLILGVMILIGWGAAAILRRV